MGNQIKAQLGTAIRNGKEENQTYYSVLYNEK